MANKKNNKIIKRTEKKEEIKTPTALNNPWLYLVGICCRKTLIRDGTHRGRIRTCVILRRVLTLLLLHVSDSHGGGGRVHHGGRLSHSGRGVRGKGIAPQAAFLGRSSHVVQVAVDFGEQGLSEDSLLLHVRVVAPAVVTGSGDGGGSHHHRALVRSVRVDTRLQGTGRTLETRREVGGRYPGVVYSRVRMRRRRRRGEASKVVHGRRGSVRVRGGVYGNGDRGSGIGERRAVGRDGGTDGGAHEGRLGGRSLGRHDG